MVSSAWGDHFACLTVDFPFAEVFEMTIDIDLKRVSKHKFDVIKVVGEWLKSDQKGLGNIKDTAKFFDKLANALMLRTGVYAVGLTTGITIELADFIPVLNALPTITIAGCVEELVYCHDGPGTDDCKNMRMVKPKPRGFLCAEGINCHKCGEAATWWWGHAAMKCGKETPWADGYLCGEG